MKTNLKSSLSEKILVGAAFAIWVATGIVIEDKLLEYSGAYYIFGTLIFFFVAFFVPERPRGSFISRCQILKLASFFLWLGGSQLLLLGENSLRTNSDSSIPSLALGLITIVSPFVFYWASTFLIRGYHTEPQYQTNEEAEQVGDGDAEEAV